MTILLLFVSCTTPMDITTTGTTPEIQLGALEPADNITSYTDVTIKWNGSIASKPDDFTGSISYTVKFGHSIDNMEVLVDNHVDTSYTIDKSNFVAGSNNYWTVTAHVEGLEAVTLEPRQINFENIGIQLDILEPEDNIINSIFTDVNIKWSGSITNKPDDFTGSISYTVKFGHSIDNMRVLVDNHVDTSYTIEGYNFDYRNGNYYWTVTAQVEGLEPVTTEPRKIIIETPSEIIEEETYNEDIIEPTGIYTFPMTIVEESIYKFITSFHLNNTDTIMYIDDVNGNRIAYNDDGQENAPYSEIIMKLEPGDYEVIIESKGEYEELKTHFQIFFIELIN